MVQYDLDGKDHRRTSLKRIRLRYYLPAEAILFAGVLIMQMTDHREAEDIASDHQCDISHSCGSKIQHRGRPPFCSRAAAVPRMRSVCRSSEPSGTGSGAEHGIRPELDLLYSLTGAADRESSRNMSNI